MRQQQFRQNMRRDEVLAKVSQDDDVLVAYIRQWQLSSAAKPFPPHSRHPPLPPEPLPLVPTPTESVVAELLKHKVNIHVQTLVFQTTQYKMMLIIEILAQRSIRGDRSVQCCVWRWI